MSCIILPQIRVRVVGNGMNCSAMDQEQQQSLLGQPRPSKRPRTAVGAAGSGNGNSSSMQNQQDSSPPQVESALHADAFRASQHRSSAHTHHNLHVTLPFGGTRQMRNGRERNTSLASLDSAMTAAASVQLPQVSSRLHCAAPTIVRHAWLSIRHAPRAAQTDDVHVPWQLQYDLGVK